MALNIVVEGVDVLHVIDPCGPPKLGIHDTARTIKATHDSGAATIVSFRYVYL